MVLRKAAGNSLIYALKLSAELKNDQVVAGKKSLGFCDIDLITANVQSSSGDRTVTGLTLTRSDSTGTWNTINDTKWALGAAASLDSLLYNGADSAVNFPLSDGSSFNIFAADASSGSGYFTAGSVFTLTADFSDGSSASAFTILPSAPPPPSAPTLALSFDGKLTDRVGRADAALSADGSLDGTFTVTVQPSIFAIQDGDLAFVSVNGTDILSALLETKDDDEDDDD
jgi:hypothetical protein